MKKGQFIQKRTYHGIKYGSYLIIEEITRYGIHARYPNTNLRLYMSKKSIRPVTMFSLPISEQMYWDLKNGKKYKVSHKATSRWLSVFNNRPELIRFYTMAKGYSIVFTVDSVLSTVSMGDRYIDILINQKVI